MQLSIDLYRESRPNIFEIDLRPIAEAFGELRRRVGRRVKIFPALKANAYGFGLEPVAHCLTKSGADGFAVVDRAHGVALRQSGITVPVLVYPNDLISADLVRCCEQWDLIPTAMDQGSAELLSKYASRAIAIAVKVDVGQERLGVIAEDAAALMVSISRLPKLRLAIVNTHPFVPVEDGNDCLQWEFERFTTACQRAAASGVLATRLFASSKCLQRNTATALDAVDPGRMLFPSSAIRSLRSRLIHSRVVTRDRFIGQAPFPVRRGMRYGVIPIGAADGVGGCTSGDVLVRGQRCAVIGLPSLEYTRIDLSNAPDATVGDEVAVIGRQGDASITPEEVMERRGYNWNVDIAMAIRETVARSYVY